MKSSLLPSTPRLFFRTALLGQHLACFCRIATTAMVVLASLAWLPGCGGRASTEETNSRRTGANSEQGRVDNLLLAMSLIYSDERFETHQLNQNIAMGLNEWIETIDVETDWSLADIVETLPEEYRNDVASMGIDKMSFNARDVEALQEARWLDALTTWLGDSNRFADYRFMFSTALAAMDEDEQAVFARSEDRLAYLVDATHDELTPEQAKQMATSLRLFDWIVRNVQLMELRRPPNEAEIIQRALVTAPHRSAAGQGAPGPGYTLFPWQSMKFGRGDAWQRARLFILGCRQIDVDAVMLAIPDENGVPVPWLPALRFDSRLYLFDPGLGIPIPAPSGDGIATLTDAIDEPIVLDRLDVPSSDANEEALVYPVKSQDAAKCIALLDLGPTWLSRRMRVLQSNLVGEYRLMLTIDAASLVDRVEQCDQISEVRLWDLPYATLVYRNIYDMAVQKRADRIGAQHLIEEGVFDLDIRLAIGRHRAILGKIESDDATQFAGAKSLFSERRVPEEFVEMIESERELQMLYGIDVTGDMSADQVQEAVRMVQTQVRMVRTHATYWLAISHFELGNPSASESWLTRVGEDDPRGTWIDGVQYHLARCAESVARYDLAIERYREPPQDKNGVPRSTTPQRHGDLIRAGLLESLMTEQSAN